MTVRTEHYELPVELHASLLKIMDDIATHLCRSCDLIEPVGAQMTIFIVRKVLDIIEKEIPVVTIDRKNSHVI